MATRSTDPGGELPIEPDGTAPEAPAAAPTVVDEPSLSTAASPAESPEALEHRLRAVGSALLGSLKAVLEALPGAPRRPSQLSRAVGCNRAVASKVLAATRRRDPLEVLHQIPGPEPLRRLVRAAVDQGVAADTGDAALDAIASFDGLIRDDAGTRAALDAMISSSLPGARERVELASKYSVFKGMSQLKGAQAELWLGTAVVAPSAADPKRHDLTFLNGALGIQRLRRGVAVRFSYRHESGGEQVDDRPGEEELPGLGVLALDQFCVNPPARLEARRAGNVLHYVLPDDRLGSKERVDMFVVDHHPAAMSRTSKPAPRRRNSLFVEPALPVATLVFDVALHDEAFPGSEPELYVYDTGYDGIANVNDESRDIDRTDLSESVEFLGHDLARVHATELPSYSAVLAHLGERFGWDPKRFRIYRTRIQYPVYGWQVSLSFEPPLVDDVNVSGG